MVAHDNKRYHNRRLEPFSDPEYEAAAATNEPERYYWVINGAAKYIKRYKPAVAKLFEKRIRMYHPGTTITKVQGRCRNECCARYSY